MPPAELGPQRIIQKVHAAKVVMEYYLESALDSTDRDTQLLFQWTDLWSTFHLHDRDLSEAFTDIKRADLQWIGKGIDKFSFQGWRVEWTGWKRITNSDYLVCQWLAYDPAWYRWHLYSSWPGACGAYKAGFIFDISMKQDQWAIITRHQESDKLDAKLRCLWTLLMKIRDVGGPPHDPYAGVM